MQSSLHIGFTKQYYTLWSIGTDQIRNANGTGYDTTNFVYLQNLSKDLHTAQEKAAALGATDLEPSHELYGRNQSFRERKPVFNFPEISDAQMLYRIYITNGNDYTAEQKAAAAERLLEIGAAGLLNVSYSGERTAEPELYMIANGDYSSAQYRLLAIAERESKMLQSGTEQTYVCEKNADSYGNIHFSGLGTVNFDCKQMYYNGFNYGLPIIDGKAGKVKGKKLTFTILYIADGADFKAINVRFTDAAVKKAKAVRTPEEKKAKRLARKLKRLAA